MSAALVTTGPTGPTDTRFSDEQKRLILDTCCGGASPKDAAVLIAIAEQRGLNPILGECYFVERYDTEKQRKVWAVQASIDSFRIKADETGLYDGQDEPEYEYDPKSGALLLARVAVWRKGWSRPAVGVARYDEYVQKKKDGQPTRFWRAMPHNQLAKCAEALAMRKAFPKLFARVYTAAEMEQADNPEPKHNRETGELPHNVPTTQAHPPTTPAPPPVHVAATDDGIRYEPGWYLEKYRDAYAAATTLEALRPIHQALKQDADAGKLDPAHVALLRAVAERRKAALESAATPRNDEPWDDADDAREPAL